MLIAGLNQKQKDLHLMIIKITVISQIIVQTISASIKDSQWYADKRIATQR